MNLTWRYRNISQGNTRLSNNSECSVSPTEPEPNDKEVEMRIQSLDLFLIEIATSVGGAQAAGIPGQGTWETTLLGRG